MTSKELHDLRKEANETVAVMAQAGTEIDRLRERIKELEQSNNGMRGALSLILIYPNIKKHIGGELVNLAMAALGGQP